MYYPTFPYQPTHATPTHLCQFHSPFWAAQRLLDKPHTRFWHTTPTQLYMYYNLFIALGVRELI